MHVSLCFDSVHSERSGTESSLLFVSAAVGLLRHHCVCAQGDGISQSPVYYEITLSTSPQHTLRARGKRAVYLLSHTAGLRRMLVFINYLSADCGRINSSFDIQLCEIGGETSCIIANPSNKRSSIILLCFEQSETQKHSFHFHFKTKKSSKSTHFETGNTVVGNKDDY